MNKKEIQYLLSLDEVKNDSYAIYNHSENLKLSVESVELFIYFVNPLNQFLNLFKQFQLMMEDSMFKEITFVSDINAIYIKTNKYQDFKRFGIEEFEEEYEEELKQFEGNRAFINASFLYWHVQDALRFFKLFYGRPVLHI